MSKNTNKPLSENPTWQAIGAYAEAKEEIERLTAEKAALVQQGIRDHGDWRSKLNFLEADYKAEIARLTAENERIAVELEQRCHELNLSLGQQGVQLRQIGELTAENERLRKAGDAFFDSVIGYYGEHILEDKKHSSGQMCRDWIAAKKGRDAK